MTDDTRQTAPGGGRPLATNDARLLVRVVQLAAGAPGLTDGALAQGAASAVRLAGAVELAYGLLWLGVHSENPDGRWSPDFGLLCQTQARLALLGTLDRAGQARGIAAAKTLTGAA